MMSKISGDDLNTNLSPEGKKVRPVQAAELRSPGTQSGKQLPVDVAKAERAEAAEEAKKAENLDKAVKNLNDHMQVVKRELHFSIDDDSGKTIIKVMDLETKKMIRQIPNEEALTVARKLIEGEDIELFNRYT